MIRAVSNGGLGTVQVTEKMAEEGLSEDGLCDTRLKESGLFLETLGDECSKCSRHRHKISRNPKVTTWRC